MNTRTAPVRLGFATLLMLSLATRGSVAAPPEAQEKPSPRLQQRQAPQTSMVCVRKVPDLSRYDFQFVGDLLKKAGLALGQVTDKPSSAQKGTILWQSMEPGSPAKCDTPIAVVVSTGPRFRDDVKVKVPPETEKPIGCQVPDLRKHHIDDVQAPLRKGQWSIRNTKERPSPAKPGTILEQWPLPGVSEKCEGWIDIVVAVEIVDPPPPPTPPPCEVADFRGLNIKDALGKVKATGHYVKSVDTEPSLKPADMVIAQSEKPGAVLPCGSPLVLIIATAPPPPPIPDCDVPDMFGAEINAAVQKFAAAGLKVGGVKPEHSNRLPDTVIMQTLKPGSRVPCDSRVYLHVSAGPEMCDVPNLETIDLAVARRALKERRFQLGQVSTQNSDRIADTVLGQYPLANSTAECGSKINVTIAVPWPLVDVPALEGQDADSARRTLEDVGLTLGQVGRKFSGLQSGLVMEQQPVVNTPVQRGTAVRIWISDGPAPRAVPDLRGLARKHAEDALLKAGFSLGEVFDRQFDATPGTIVAQQPAARSVERVGTVVRVWVAVPLPPPPPPPPPAKPEPPAPTPVTPTPVTPTPVTPTPVTQPPVTPPHAGPPQAAPPQAAPPQSAPAPVTPAPVPPAPVPPAPVTPTPVTPTPVTAIPAPVVPEPAAPQLPAEAPRASVENPAPPVPVLRPIPNVVGSSESQASNALRAAGFVARSLSITPSTAPTGTVTGQRPAAGQLAAPGTEVALEIAPAVPSQSTVPMWWVVLGVLAAAAAAGLIAKSVRRASKALPLSVRLEPRPDANMAVTLSGDGPLIRSELWWKACPDAGVQTAHGAGPFGMMEVTESR